MPSVFEINGVTFHAEDIFPRCGEICMSSVYIDGALPGHLVPDGPDDYVPPSGSQFGYVSFSHRDGRITEIHLHEVKEGFDLAYLLSLQDPDDYVEEYVTKSIALVVA